MNGYRNCVEPGDSYRLEIASLDLQPWHRCMASCPLEMSWIGSQTVIAGWVKRI